MSGPSAFRPTLLPALRRLWRDSHRLQLGTDPDRAVVLELANPTSARLLDLLDGTRTEPRLIGEAVRQGIDAGDVTAILNTLRAAGLVVDSRSLRPVGIPDPVRRRLDREAAALALRGPGRGVRPNRAAAVLGRRLAARVVVTGASLLAVPIACALAAAGVGRVDPRVHGVAKITDALPGGLAIDDAHRPRAVAAADAVRRAAPDAARRTLRAGEATFAVLVGDAAPSALTALSLGRRRLPHLAVTLRDAAVVVGPLVRPGITPCLNCLDLRRADCDPCWRTVAAQLATSPDSAEPVAATTALAAVAYATAEVLAHIDGGTPTTLGATVEITEPGRVTRRRWAPHPRCGCANRGRSLHH